MNNLEIEWRHLVESGETCDRCSMTGETLKKVIEDLKLLSDITCGRKACR